MKKTALILSLVFWHSSFSLAASEGETYVGIQFSQLYYDNEEYPEEAKPTAFIGRYGYFFNDQFSAESRLGFGLGDDTLDFGVDLDIEVEHIYGIYGLYRYVSNDVSFYGVFGLSKGELTGKGSGTSESNDESGLSYGFGMEVKSFNLEYMLYLDEDSFEVSAIALGYVFEF